MTERRKIVPARLCREGRDYTVSPYDRRPLFTDLDCYCRHFQSQESVTLYHARRRLPAPEEVRV